MKELIQINNEKYCWVHEVPMLKTIHIIAMVWRVLLAAAVIILIPMTMITLISGGGFSQIVFDVKMLALVFGILAIITIPAYLIVTGAYNGKYTVMFEMDRDGIDHIAIKNDKVQALEKLTILAGEATRNPSVTGSGILAASGGSLYSSFDKVRVLKAYPNDNLIKVNSLFVRNMIWVDSENFDFIWGFIREHCPQARIEIH